MRISAKGRYALISTTYLSQKYRENSYITVQSISENMDISKIYLEQIFSSLKKGGLVVSIKGSQGGYRLSRKPEDISAYDILDCVEQALFEKIEPASSGKSKAIEAVITELVFDKLDESVAKMLKRVSLSQIAEKSSDYLNDNTLMFYI